jgi:hypothetical protein
MKKIKSKLHVAIGQSRADNIEGAADDKEMMLKRGANLG